VFYKNNNINYFNQHLESIQGVLKYVIKQLNLTNSYILDMCAGSGEVSNILKKIVKSKIIGCDPYTYELYTWSFDDMLNCVLEDISFDCIICSYALHLCP
jgi:ubiquinone/menaquinone biosynthesis C-methylase UbiE